MDHRETYLKSGVQKNESLGTGVKYTKNWVDRWAQWSHLGIQIVVGVSKMSTDIRLNCSPYWLCETDKPTTKSKVNTNYYLNAWHLHSLHTIDCAKHLSSLGDVSLIPPISASTPHPASVTNIVCKVGNVEGSRAKVWVHRSPTGWGGGECESSRAGAWSWKVPNEGWLEGRSTRNLCGGGSVSSLEAASTQSCDAHCASKWGKRSEQPTTNTQWQQKPVVVFLCGSGIWSPQGDVLQAFR